MKVKFDLPSTFKKVDVSINVLKCNFFNNKLVNKWDVYNKIFENILLMYRSMLSMSFNKYEINKTWILK